MPPSLPVSMCFVLSGSIHSACSSTCLASQPARLQSLPPFSVTIMNVSML